MGKGKREALHYAAFYPVHSGNPSSCSHVGNTIGFGLILNFDLLSYILVRDQSQLDRAVASGRRHQRV